MDNSDCPHADSRIDCAIVTDAKIPVFFISSFARGPTYSRNCSFVNPFNGLISLYVGVSGLVSSFDDSLGFSVGFDGVEVVLDEADLLV